MNNLETQLPHSEPCERNKHAIFNVLAPLLAHTEFLLEIGSGTGQHAVWMAKQLPHVKWQPSETEHYLNMLQPRLDAEAPDNVLPPLTIDVANYPWLPSTQENESPDVLLTCNTLHIMSKHHVEALWKHAGLLLQAGALAIVYGPFKYNGDFTTPSNAGFDVWLKQRDAVSGVRDFEWVNQLASDNGFECLTDHDMPANNQFIVWQKLAAN
ncbi:MAG TPA: methylase [Gammaproteobacteria bacterium]|nr:DUF938 domain-containing protein [Pseudomonadota bacterium]HAY45307.1 methylase [Gammaproteobacteria bacterium]